MQINNLSSEVEATNGQCIPFLKELTANRGAMLQRLAINSDCNNDPSIPTGIFIDTDLKTVLSRCPNLTELKLHRCLSLTEKSLKKVGNLTHLKFLSLSCCTGTTDMVLLCLQNTALEKLNLHNSYKVTSVGFTVISTFKGLKELVLGNCRELENEDLRRYSKLQLTALDISGCEKITDEGLNSLLKMQNLKILCGVSSAASLPNTSHQMRNKFKKHDDYCFYDPFLLNT